MADDKADIPLKGGGAPPQVWAWHKLVQGPVSRMIGHDKKPLRNDQQRADVIWQRMLEEAVGDADKQALLSDISAQHVIAWIEGLDVPRALAKEGEAPGMAMKRGEGLHQIFACATGIAPEGKTEPMYNLLLRAWEPAVQAMHDLPLTIVGGDRVSIPAPPPRRFRDRATNTTPKQDAIFDSIPGIPARVKDEVAKTLRYKDLPPYARTHIIANTLHLGELVRVVREMDPPIFQRDFCPVEPGGAKFLHPNTIKQIEQGSALPEIETAEVLFRAVSGRDKVAKDRFWEVLIRQRFSAIQHSASEGQASGYLSSMPRCYWQALLDRWHNPKEWAQHAPVWADALIPPANADGTIPSYTRGEYLRCARHVLFGENCEIIAERLGVTVFPVLNYESGASIAAQTLGSPEFWQRVYEVLKQAQTESDALTEHDPRKHPKRDIHLPPTVEEFMALPLGRAYRLDNLIVAKADATATPPLNMADAPPDPAVDAGSAQASGTVKSDIALGL